MDVHTVTRYLPFFVSVCCVLIGCTRATELDLTELSDSQIEKNKTYKIYLVDGTQYISDRLRIKGSVLIVDNLKSDLLGVKTPFELQFSEIAKIEALTFRENATGLAIVGTGLIIAAVVILATWEWPQTD